MMKTLRRMTTTLFLTLPLLFASGPFALSAPVHDAAIDGNVDLVLSLIEADPSMLEIRNEIGASPLYYAASEGHLELTNKLIALGAEVTVATNDGLTPLHWAALRAHIEVCEVLLDNGSDVNARSTVQGNTPLHEVWNNGGSVDVALLLIERGAEIDAVEKWYGMSILHYAANKGLPELARALIERGADLTLRDRYGMTPSTHARDAATRAVFADHRAD